MHYVTILMLLCTDGICYTIIIAQRDGFCQITDMLFVTHSGQKQLRLD